MKFLTKPRKRGMWIAVVTVILGCGVMAVVSLILINIVFSGVGPLRY